MPLLLGHLASGGMLSKFTSFFKNYCTVVPSDIMKREPQHLTSPWSRGEILVVTTAVLLILHSKVLLGTSKYYKAAVQ